MPVVSTTPPRATARSAARPPAKRRLSPDERKAQILDEAVRYFAEVGFEGQTRELSTRLGVDNALLFRYFPTKEDLIEQVYQVVFVRRWKPEWETIIKDRSRPLRRRLEEYYRSYLSVAFSYEWLRIFFYASLRGISIKDRYLRLVEQQVIVPICVELRAHYGLEDPDVVPITEVERDTALCLHGEIVYIAIRRFIYNQPITDPGAISDRAVQMFLASAKPVIKAAIEEGRLHNSSPVKSRR
jgi:AcrR family transcriptional regulator